MQCNGGSKLMAQLRHFHLRSTDKIIIGPPPQDPQSPKLYSPHMGIKNCQNNTTAYSSDYLKR